MESKYRVGDFVYMPYSPLKPGKVLKISSPDKFGCYTIDVKWINGKTSQHKDFHLRSFTALIDDHKKKLKTHTSKLPALRKL